MSNDYGITNEGIGAGPFPTFVPVKDKKLTFTQDNIDNNEAACIVSGNNEVSTGPGRLYGKVVWVSTDTDKDGFPETCAVQFRGIARFKYDPKQRPELNGSVRAVGGGLVDEDNSGHNVVINITPEYVDVSLG